MPLVISLLMLEIIWRAPHRKIFTKMLWLSTILAAEPCYDAGLISWYILVRLSVDVVPSPNFRRRLSPLGPRNTYSVVLVKHNNKVPSGGVLTPFFDVNHLCFLNLYLFKMSTAVDHNGSATRRPQGVPLQSKPKADALTPPLDKLASDIRYAITLLANENRFLRSKLNGSWMCGNDAVVALLPSLKMHPPRRDRSRRPASRCGLGIASSTRLTMYRACLTLIRRATTIISGDSLLCSGFRWSSWWSRPCCAISRILDTRFGCGCGVC